MLPAPWASGPTFKGSGAWFPCQAKQPIAYKYVFPVVAAPSYRVLSGSGNIELTMRLWFTC